MKDRKKLLGGCMKKAKEYYEELKPIVLTMDQEKVDKCVFDLLKSLMDDMTEIIKMRKAKSDSAFLSIIEEVNNKFNSIRDKFIKDGIEFLIKDGFKTYIYKKLEIK